MSVKNIRRAIYQTFDERSKLFEELEHFYNRSDNPNAEKDEWVVSNRDLFTKEESDIFLLILGRIRYLDCMNPFDLLHDKLITQEDFDAFVAEEDRQLISHCRSFCTGLSLTAAVVAAFTITYRWM